VQNPATEEADRPDVVGRRGARGADLIGTPGADAPKAKVPIATATSAAPIFLLVPKVTNAE
jgi:hypothetical protein